MENNYEELYKILGYSFKNQEIIERALRHSSMCYSRKRKCNNYIVVKKVVYPRFFNRCSIEHKAYLST